MAFESPPVKSFTARYGSPIKGVIESKALVRSRSKVFAHMIGNRITHYEITQHAGSGGMGDVYRALDTKLNRHVAFG